MSTYFAGEQKKTSATQSATDASKQNEKPTLNKYFEKDKPYYISLSENDSRF